MKWIWPKHESDIFSAILNLFSIYSHYISLYLTLLHQEQISFWQAVRDLNGAEWIRIFPKGPWFIEQIEHIEL